MIKLSSIISRMRQIGIDAEGSDRYLDSIDMIPAVNSAVEWLVSVISTMLSTTTSIEEKLADLHLMRVWQTSKLSRIAFEDGVDFKIWKITSVIPKPTVYVSLDDRTGLSGRYVFEITPFLNKQYENQPIVSVPFTSNTPLKPHQSTFRPELAFVSGNNPATWLTTEQITESRYNPFAAGYSHPDEVMNYGYTVAMDFSSTNQGTFSAGGYQIEKPKELSLYDPKKVKQSLVAISFIRFPDIIDNDANTDTTYLPFPDSMFNIIVQKALNYIAMKEGDNTTIYNVSTQEVLQLLR